MPRSRQIFFVRKSGISRCRGTADLCLRTTLPTTSDFLLRGPNCNHNPPYGEQDRDASQLQRHFLKLLAGGLAGIFTIHFDGFV